MKKFFNELEDFLSDIYETIDRDYPATVITVWFILIAIVLIIVGVKE